MEIDFNKVKIDILKLGLDDEFVLDKREVSKKIYVQVDFFAVAKLHSDENYNHEELAEAYVKADEGLLKEFMSFKEKTGDTSYKDFLILRHDAIATADKTPLSPAEVICTMEGGSGALNKILNAYLRAGYKVRQPKITLQNGTYGLH